MRYLVDYKKSMAERCFAMFDDDAKRLKLVRMNERADSILELSAHAASTPSSTHMNIAMSNEPEPMLKRIPLDGGEHLYLWRSPWCTYRAETKTWIPILDSDKRSAIPGEFLYEGEWLFHKPPSVGYKQLREKMTQKAVEIERHYMKHVTAAAPPQTPPNKPPRFLAEIIKRDAIANRTSCAISLDDITQDMKTLVTPCFHIFEAASLGEWIAQKGSCPTCKGPVKQETCLLL